MTETKAKLSVLFLRVVNSCRSQMAATILRLLDSELQVFSAGTKPASQVHTKAVAVMKEIGIDLFRAYPQRSINSLTNHLIM